MKIIKSVYKILQIRIIYLLSFIWAKNFQFQQFEKILILSPHPDDEIIGCAGLIQKLMKQQKEVFILMITGGGASWDTSLIDSSELIAKRKELSMSAAEIIGLPYEHYIYLGWEDSKLKEMVNHSERQHDLAHIIDTVKPSVILLPHRCEVSEDHYSLQKTFSNSLKFSKYKTKIFYYWVHSMRPLREFVLGWRKSFIINLDNEEYKIKSRALDAYVKPLAPFGKPYSGELPESLLYSMKWDKELFFETK